MELKNSQFLTPVGSIEQLKKNVQRFRLKLHADRQNCKISKNHTQ